MAITNRVTSGASLLVNGVTGGQSVTMIPAARVFMKATADPLQAATPVLAPLGNGTSPGASWLDLGSLDGGVTTTYTKTKKDIKTGIDQKLRASYVSETTFELTFNLLQVDDYAISKVLGLTPSILQSGSSASFALGQETFGQYALLCVWQNKLDGKEHQIYHPAAFLDAVIVNQQDHLVLKCDAKFPAFINVNETQERLVSYSIFDLQ